MTDNFVAGHLLKDVVDCRETKHTSADENDCVYVVCFGWGFSRFWRGKVVLDLRGPPDLALFLRTRVVQSLRKGYKMAKMLELFASLWPQRCFSRPRDYPLM